MKSKVPVLFDVNGLFGREVAASSNDCPTMADRLAHMNRLGISRSLVWNVESTQNHALSANDHTLKAIAETPGAKDRIYSAMTVSGLMLYEEDGIKRLKQQMKEGNTRALRFVNLFGMMSLSQIVPVIEAIRPLKPFIVLKHDAAVPQDILAFVDQFPDVTIILTDVMWPSCIKTFDLMRRCSNITLDISWFHTWDGIELAVRHFGAKRIVFGTGYRSHNGAAIAALARADISDTDRTLIAHGNLDRLMGLKTKALVVADTTKQIFWQKCLAGEQLGVDFIDAHGHLGPSGGYVLEIQDEDGQIKAGKQTMDSLGMKLMILSGMQALLGDPIFGNDLLADKLRGQTSHFAAYATFNPFYAKELVSKFDSYFKNPAFLGFKTLCSYWKVKINDPRFKPMWEYANRHRLPILSHTWGKDDIINLKDVVKKYPGAQFLLGHSGGGDDGRIEAEILAQNNKNVYLEWCGSFCTNRSWNDTIDLVGPGKIVFGTDAMAHGIDWELGRLLSLDVPDNVIRPILGENMRRILKMRR